MKKDIAHLSVGRVGEYNEEGKKAQLEYIENIYTK